MTRTVAVIQSHYIPWAGFFDLIGGCSDVVILDSVSFSKNSFFNRNRLIGPNGPFWLTIPVKTVGRSNQPISNVELIDDGWVNKHRRSVEQCLAHAPYFEQVWPLWRDLFLRCRSETRLSKVNRLWLESVMVTLGLKTTLHDDASLSLSNSDKNSRLIGICKEVGANIYRTGPRSLDYLNTRLFDDAGIVVEIIEYGDYYPFRSSSAHEKTPVSILDNIANLGPRATDVLKHSFRRATS